MIQREWEWQGRSLWLFVVFSLCHTVWPCWEKRIKHKSELIVDSFCLVRCDLFYLSQIPDIQIEPTNSSCGSWNRGADISLYTVYVTWNIMLSFENLCILKFYFESYIVFVATFNIFFSNSPTTLDQTIGFKTSQKISLPHPYVKDDCTNFRQQTPHSKCLSLWMGERYETSVCVRLVRWSSPAWSLGKLKAVLSGIREWVLGVAEGRVESTGGFWEFFSVPFAMIGIGLPQKKPTRNNYWLFYFLFQKGGYDQKPSVLINPFKKCTEVILKLNLARF